MLKTNKNINLHEPIFKGNEKKYLIDCLKSTYVSTFGKYLKLFEKKIKSFTNSKNVVLTNSGTSALHLALKSLNIQTNHEVIVPSVTFIAPINTVMYNNSIPIFIGCDKYYNIDPEKVIEFIKKKTIFKNNQTINLKTKRIISALIIVHVFGNAVLLDNLITLCKKRKILIIEDASEALGTFYKSGKYKGKHVGTVANIGCISFNGNKILTSSSGGAILTNNKVLSNKCIYLSTQSKDDKLFFRHNNIGFNYRMTNLSAALGLAQLEQISFFLDKKYEIYKHYVKVFQNSTSFKILSSPPYSQSNYWLNILIIKNLNIDRNIILKKLIKNNINVRPIWYPNHLQKPFKIFQIFKTNKVKKLTDRAICLPSSSFLSLSDIKKIYYILHK